MAKCMALVGDLLGEKAPINSYKLEKMTRSLTFSNEKARKELDWEPLDVLTNYKIWLKTLFCCILFAEYYIEILDDNNLWNTSIVIDKTTLDRLKYN